MEKTIIMEPDSTLQGETQTCFFFSSSGLKKTLVFFLFSNVKIYNYTGMNATIMIVKKKKIYTCCMGNNKHWKKNNN